jgi:nanoRNase/pAp phosphatase (c-di-AMP/oligoRNAs hydrolase)
LNTAATTINFAGAATTLNIGAATGTTTFAGSTIPQNSQSAAYELVAADANKHVLHPVADDNPRTFTIPANSAVAFPIGTAVTFVNMQNTVSIAITTDAMTLMGAGSTGTRTLAENGIATALKITATTWVISGTGLT